MIYAILTPAAEIAEFGGIFKYVRLVDDSLRFSDVSTMPDHCRMVDENDPAPKSAGSVAVRPDKSVRTLSHGSMTLNLPSLADDEDLIRKAIFGQ